MNKKISDLPTIVQAAMETGLEFELEQEGISYKVSLAMLITFLQTYFMTLGQGNTKMPYSGGAFTGTVQAKNEDPTTTFAVRNAKVTFVDPGVGSALTTGHILLVADES